MATETVQDAEAAAAEKLAEAAEAVGGEASTEEGASEELLGGEGDQWTFFTKALVAVVVIIVCLVANKVSLAGARPLPSAWSSCTVGRCSYVLSGAAYSAASTSFIDVLRCCPKNSSLVSPVTRK